MAAGLALAVPILGGLLLYAVGVPLHRPGWLGLLAGVTLAGDVVLFLRRRAGRAAPFSWPPAVARTAAARRRPSPPPSWSPPARWRWPGSAWLTSHSPVSPSCGCHPRARSAHTLSLGVSNNQGSTTSYRLVLLRNGQVSATWNLTLASGQTWQRSVPVHRHVHPHRRSVPAARPDSSLPVRLHRQRQTAAGS